MFLRHNSLIRKHFNGKKRLFWKHPYLLLLPACCIAPIMVTEVKFDLKKKTKKQKKRIHL